MLNEAGSRWAELDEFGGDKFVWSNEIETKNPDGTTTKISYTVDPETLVRRKETRIIREVTKLRRENIGVHRRLSMAKFGYEAFNRSRPDIQNFICSGVIGDDALVAVQKGSTKFVQEDAASSALDTEGVLIGTTMMARKTQSEVKKLVELVNETDLDAFAAASEAPRDPIMYSAMGMGMGMGGPSDRMKMQSDDSTLRVTHLTEFVQEDDLQRLFSKCGDTVRVHVVRDKETGKGKGCAFITYRTKQEAQKAVNELNRYGFQNLILNVEFSKPREVMMR